jgi:multidrug resistance efflux pump
VGGRVASTHVEEGSVVTKGQILVELEPFDLLERRAQAAANLSARKAAYDKLNAGFRSEEKSQAKARVDQLAARLEKLENGPRTEEISAAQARVHLAQADLELAQTNYARTETLRDRQVATAEDMDQATKELKVARANVEVRTEGLALLLEGTRPEEIEEARAQKEEARQAWLLTENGYRSEEIAEAKSRMDAAAAALASIARHIEELTISAPVDGTIEAVELEPGDLVSPNAPVLSIMDTSELWVRAYVPQSELRISIGQQVQITVDSYPSERFGGHISFIARQAEFTPSNVQTPEERSKQVFRIRVIIDEGLGRLRPGMAADVWLQPSDETQ